MPIDQCPLCGSIDIRTGIQIAHEAAFGYDQNVYSIFGSGKRVGRLHHHICVGCGHVLRSRAVPYDNTSLQEMPIGKEKPIE